MSFSILFRITKTCHKVDLITETCKIAETSDGRIRRAFTLLQISTEQSDDGAALVADYEVRLSSYARVSFNYPLP